MSYKVEIYEDHLYIKNFFVSHTVKYQNIKDFFITEGYLQRKFGLHSIYIITKTKNYLLKDLPDAVYFVAPNVHGFVYNNITSSYFYNMMTFTGKLTSSVGFMTLYTLVADIEMAFTNAAPKF